MFMRLLVFSCFRYIHIASSVLKRTAPSSQISCVGEDAVVLNVLLEALDQLLDCLDDIFTFGVFSESSKSDGSPSLVVGPTFAGDVFPAIR